MNHHLKMALALIATALAGSAIVLATLVGSTKIALSADKAALGGNCCGDLEERIAELESTVARKGNRKVSVTISGQINKAVLYWDGFGASNTVVTENAAAESYVAFSMVARINPDLKAGGLIEIGVGGYDGALFNGVGYGPLLGGDTNDLYTRQAYVFVESGKLGRAAVGKQRQATDGIAEITTANTDAAVRMLSVRPLIGPQLGEVADLFDGNRGDLVRYDTPTWQGFVASASWGTADLVSNGAVWDAALRYYGEYQQFRVAAGIGYRQGVIVPTIGAAEEVKVWSGSASVMHMPTGGFITGAYGHFEGEGVLAGLPEMNGWQGQGGLEERWSSLGKTTLFAEFGELEIEGVSSNFRLYGLGVVQAIDGSAMDIYASWRQYDLDAGADSALNLYMLGARIRF